MPDVSEQGPGVSEFDLFISYASEDIELVRPLVTRLQRDGHRVWFDQSDMRLSGQMAENLDAALDNCSQMLVCLSDSYCRNGFTMYELQLNFTKDPGNTHSRTIPVLVRAPFTQKIPAEVKIIAWADLTNPHKYDTEYRRIVQTLVKKRPPANFASPAEVHALRRISDPDKALARMKRYSRQINTYIYQREIGGPTLEEAAQLALQLTQSSNLPTDIKFHIGTIQRYAELIEHQGVKQSSVEPALLALFQLTTWATARYHVEHVPAEPQDPFDVLWAHLSSDPGSDNSVRLPNTTWDLAEGRRQFTKLGALYRGKNTDDDSVADLLLLPVSRLHDQEFTTEIKRCRSLGDHAPLDIRLSSRFNAAQAGEWGFIVLKRFERCTCRDLCERFGQLPQGVALAMARQIIRAFDNLQQGAPALTHSLFHFQHLVLDRSGVVRITWDWEHQGPEENNVAARHREDFWFCRAGDASLEIIERDDFHQLRQALGNALHGVVASELLEKLRVSNTAEEAAAALAPPVPPRAEDQDVVRVAVESWFEHKDLPSWISKLEEPDPKPSPVSPEPQPQSFPQPDSPSHLETEVGFRLAFKTSLECLGAWPLSRDLLLVWQADHHLAIVPLNGGQSWRDDKPIRVRRIIAASGGVAIGGWEGYLRWFGGGQLIGTATAAWTVGDLQPYSGNWLAGSWNGRLQILGADGAIKSVNPAPEDGVCRIAVSRGERFAALSMRGAVSIYQGTRTGQTEPIPAARGLAFASGLLVVLTEQGLVTVEASGRTGRPDRLPARGALRLMVSPSEENCLLINERGQSWIIDSTGTYPRGPWLPRGDDSLATACNFRRCIAAVDGGGYAYWRDGFKVRTWPEAVSAAISADGRSVVIVQPGVIETYDEDEP